MDEPSYPVRTRNGIPGLGGPYLNPAAARSNEPLYDRAVDHLDAPAFGVHSRTRIVRAGTPSRVYRRIQEPFDGGES